MDIFTMLKGTLHQEDTTLLNIYTSNQGALKYIEQLLFGLKRETDKNVIKIGDTPLAAMGRTSKLKISIEVLALNDILD